LGRGCTPLKDVLRLGKGQVGKKAIPGVELGKVFCRGGNKRKMHLRKGTCLNSPSDWKKIAEGGNTDFRRSRGRGKNQNKLPNSNRPSFHGWG